MKVLMVCLGNICRSPLAQGIMEHKLQARDLSWQVDSAGTGAYHLGESPDPRSIDIARENRIEIAHQKARQIVREDFKNFDYILTMDAQNYRDARLLAGEELSDRIELILNFLYPGENRTVPDPYFGGAQGFLKVFDMLDKACDAFIEKMVAESKS